MGTRPFYPITGTPPMTKESQSRVDLKPEPFDLLIETKGYLVAWERASMCPCMPVSEKTDQADPNCERCKGMGWFYFGAAVEQQQDYGEFGLDPIQRYFVESKSAMLIRGVISSIQSQYTPWDKIGNWAAGTLMITVRGQNRLAIYDKLTILDSEICYSEIVVADGTSVTAGRYAMTGINHIRSDEKEYIPDADFVLDERGRISWFAGHEPEEDERISLHYVCHPTYLVTEHPHTLRTTTKKFKILVPTTPSGDPQFLPVQALVRLDFIPGP